MSPTYAEGFILRDNSFPTAQIDLNVKLYSGKFQKVKWSKFRVVPLFTPLGMKDSNSIYLSCKIPWISLFIHRG